MKDFSEVALSIIHTEQAAVGRIKIYGGVDASQFVGSPLTILDILLTQFPFRKHAPD